MRPCWRACGSGSRTGTRSVRSTRPRPTGRGGPRRSSTPWCSPRPTPAGEAGNEPLLLNREGLRPSLGAPAHRGQGEGIVALAGVRQFRLRAVGSVGRRVLRGRPRGAGRRDGTRRRGRGPPGSAEHRCATISRPTTTARISMPGSRSSGPRRRSKGSSRPRGERPSSPRSSPSSRTGPATRRSTAAGTSPPSAPGSARTGRPRSRRPTAMRPGSSSPRSASPGSPPKIGRSSRRAWPG